MHAPSAHHNTMGSIFFKASKPLHTHTHALLLILFIINAALTVISIRCKQDSRVLTQVLATRDDHAVEPISRVINHALQNTTTTNTADTGATSCRHGHGWPKGCGRNGHLHYHLPDLFIYRRSHKTGSSSIISFLLPELKSLGYTMLYTHGQEANNSIHHAFIRPSNVRKRKLAVIEHNRVTRGYHPHRDAVIVDTVRDGFSQITSFCRYTMHVKAMCHTQEMQRCLRMNRTLMEMSYRWANRQGEDSDTYIDLPLSASHPALSTTVLRTVFPSIAPLKHARLHVRHSHCDAQDPRNKPLLNLYTKLYAKLEDDNLNLRKRLLTLAGYPALIDPQVERHLSIEKILDEAERMEMAKLKANGESISEEVVESSHGISQAHKLILSELKRWSSDGEGRLILQGRRINS